MKTLTIWGQRVSLADDGAMIFIPLLWESEMLECFEDRAAAESQVDFLGCGAVVTGQPIYFSKDYYIMPEAPGVN